MILTLILRTNYLTLILVFSLLIHTLLLDSFTVDIPEKKRISNQNEISKKLKVVKERMKKKKSKRISNGPRDYHVAPWNEYLR